MVHPAVSNFLVSSEAAWFSYLGRDLIEVCLVEGADGVGRELLEGAPD